MINFWLRRIALAGCLIGFFLPFLNTCTKKDRADRQHNIEASNIPSFSKPDGENYSGVGYIINDFSADNLIIWLLIISFLVPVFLLVNHVLGKPLLVVWTLILAIFGVSGLLLLLYFEVTQNLKYGFWTTFIGYLVFIGSHIAPLLRKI